ncbi:MAG: hypothetical protein KatS3mg023_3742 [Armatimonadota bacterium]|nr:MAG: hypothetical protein KatS3mg023_3742 [Armatimonadota bacterium]
MSDDLLTAVWLCGSVVKWIFMPLLESFPRINGLQIGQKRGLVLVLCTMLSPIFYQCKGISDLLLVGMSAGLVAVGQHHLFKGNKEK